MRFFLVDEDVDVIYKLTKIIEDKEFGEIIGEEEDGEIAITRIKATVPDIVILNLEIPKSDGLTIIKQIKGEHPDVCFIMISKQISKDFVEKAYRYGAEYYIYNPINSCEIAIIIGKVAEKIRINRKISKIQEIFNNEMQNEVLNSTGFCEQCIKNLLIKIGIIGEKGSDDIIKICKYLIRNKVNLNDLTLEELCSKFTDNPKTMEQRMRRSIAAGMSNIANLGLEDYMNEAFTEYSNSLYSFEQVRFEMEYIRGKLEMGGSINVKKFLLGLISYCE